MNDQTTLIGFNAICQFVHDMSEVFGKRHKPLRLYDRLSSQTKISHTEAIKKHITVFHDFCVSNREAILSKDENKLSQRKISYSDRVYIDMGFVFSIADNENKPVIWQHLLTISAIIDPSGRAKEVLKDNEKKDLTKESDFLANMVSKLENTIKPDSNPNDAIASIMQSGIVGDLLNEMRSGKLDVQKLMGSLQSTIGSMQGDDDSKQDIDLGSIMSMMSGMLGGLNLPKK